MKCKYWYWGIWLQDIEELPLKMCIVRNLLLKQCTLEELNHGDLPLYLVIHTCIWHTIWRIWNAWWNMVPEEIQHVCNNINEEQACRITHQKYQSAVHQKYQSTIGFKITTRSIKFQKNESCNLAKKRPYNWPAWRLTQISPPLSSNDQKDQNWGLMPLKIIKLMEER